MYLKALKYKGTYKEEGNNTDPEVCGTVEMLKEPSLFIDGTSVAVNYINKRIKLKYHKKSIIVDHIDIPENGSCPHTNLKYYGYYLA